MPTENEKKFVLVPSHRLEELVASLTKDHLAIEQGYLVTEPTVVRVRKSVHRQSGVTSYKMTVKHVGGWPKKRTIEVESPLDERDYRDMWPATKCRVFKNRYLYAGWDVDFFYSLKHGLYFAMAEYEMPEGQEVPDEIPDLIQSHLLYAVPEQDRRFSSRKLGKVRYALGLLSWLSLKTQKRAV